MSLHRASFGLASGLTATGIVTERRNGTWNRLLSVGISPLYFVLSNLIVGSICMMVQSFEISAAMIFLQWTSFNWNFIIGIISICSLIGFCGIAFGLLCSVTVTTILAAFMISQFATLPIYCISGEFDYLRSAIKYLNILTFCRRAMAHWRSAKVSPTHWQSDSFCRSSRNTQESLCRELTAEWRKVRPQLPHPFGLVHFAGCSCVLVCQRQKSKKSYQVMKSDIIDFVISSAIIKKFSKSPVVHCEIYLPHELTLEPDAKESGQTASVVNCDYLKNETRRSKWHDRCLLNKFRQPQHDRRMKSNVRKISSSVAEELKGNSQMLLDGCFKLF